MTAETEGLEGKDEFRDFLDQEAAELLREVIENNPGTNVHVLPKEVAREVLTPKRMEVIQTLREEEVDSKRDLAKKLGRDIKNVSGDLEVLWNHSIIDYSEGKGTSKIPELTADRIIIEPL